MEIFKEWSIPAINFRDIYKDFCSDQSEKGFLRWLHNTSLASDDEPRLLKIVLCSYVGSVNSIIDWSVTTTVFVIFFFILENRGEVYRS